MNIGIVVYSQTGNTRSVAAKLEQALAAQGHRVALQDVKLAAERKQGAKTFEFGPLPRVDEFDALVFGSPVEAFSLSPVMAKFLEALPSLEKKKVACLVTQGFPYPWLGGNRAVRQMQRQCQARGGTVVGSAVVGWMGAGLDERIVRAVERLSKVF